MMKKTFILLLIFVIVSFSFMSCIGNGAVSYCPFCGKTSIKEYSEYDISTGKTTIWYKCENSKCGKTFGAGLVEL